MNSIRFSVFADLHYKKKMYPAKVCDLTAITDRARSEGAELILHAGDFCNDYAHSPEILTEYLSCELPVFGVYGNHELESNGNSMENVTPCLTNSPKKVVWGTENGDIGNGNIAYYYYDSGCFRFILLDTNYSLIPDGSGYEHNRPASWTKPKENSKTDSLGTEQLLWLKKTLDDAAEAGMHCIVCSHASFSGIWGSSPDAEKVRKLYAKANQTRENTVILSINGHYHSDHIEKVDGVLYFDVNTAINGWWQSEAFHPYAEPNPDNPIYTFEFTDYDEKGNPIDTVNLPYSSLSMGPKTLYFLSPLSAIVTAREDGKIEINGCKTEWAYGISIPMPEHYGPFISDLK